MTHADTLTSYWTIHNFNETCLTSQIPMQYITKNYPLVPAVSYLYNVNTSCGGIATDIEKKEVGTNLIIQYFVYAYLVIYAFILMQREIREKRNVRLAYFLGGVYRTDVESPSFSAPPKNLIEFKDLVVKIIQKVMEPLLMLLACVLFAYSLYLG